jgi:hypothetical protein
MLSYIREEGDHIVLCLFFDLENALNGKGGFLLYVLKSFGGNEAFFSHGFAGSDFYIEPFGIPIFSFPDASHLRAGVPTDHRKTFFKGRIIRLRQDTLQLAAERNGKATAP